jgi:cell division protein FtsI (penicillin-binding protein 3)
MAATPRPLGARGWPMPRRRASRVARRRAAVSRGDTTRLRVLWLLATALLLAGSIWARLAYWQVVQHDRLTRMAAAYHLAQVTLPAVRGEIHDRDGSPLAIDTTVYDVTLDPKKVDASDRDRVADGLAGQVGVPRETVLELLRSGRDFAYVSHRQPQPVADRIRSMDLPGVGLDPQTQRAYQPGGTPDVTLASSLIGFVDYGGHGRYGVEQRFDGAMAGRGGSLLTYRDSLGREISLGSEQRRAPVNGAGLTLTIDSNVQYAAEQAIADGVKAAHAVSGSVIVLDARTGAVAAWADYPAYDANRFTGAPAGQLKDPMLSDIYEPGSVMKVVTLAGALDQGRITPDTTISDPGYVDVGGVRLHDWDDRNHGTVTMTNVLESSLNVGAVHAEQAEGQDAFLHYLDAFGVGRPSGVDVSGETVAPLRSSWRPSELATASFGQGVAVNVVQMGAALNAIANQGRWVQPHVVAGVGGTPPPAPAQRQAVSPQAAAAMTRMMESVVQHGSGYLARVPGFEQDEAGKTGTSQMIENGGYSTDHVWASYAGFLPASSPRFTMLVVVRQPNNGSQDHNEGYYVSGPIWKRIAEQIVQYWRITPGAAPSSN